MRTIETKLYLFDELSEAAQKRAMWDALEWITDYDWWSHVYDCQLSEEGNENEIIQVEDITVFDLDDRKAEIVYNINMKLFKERYGDRWTLLRDTPEDSWEYVETETDAENEQYSEIEELIDELVSDRKHDILLDLAVDYDYLTSDECIRETLSVNEYEFYENGKRHHP